MALQSKRFKSANELLVSAGERASQALGIGTAHALPLPQKIGSDIQVMILYYDEAMAPGEELVYPPHHIITVHAVTGNVLRFEACRPQDLGVNKPAHIPVKGFGLDPKMTADEYWEKTDRFLDISAVVWEAYAMDLTQLGPLVKSIVKEYDTLFRQIAKKPLLPYYEAVAPDFFKWLKKVLP